MNLEIRLIETDKLASIIPLLQILNDAIPEAVLRQRLEEMIKQGYQCVGAYDGEKLIGICGLWLLTKYYVGRHLEPDNVVVLPEYRSQRIGKLLIDWVCEFAKQQDCVAIELNCYLQNESGQAFWEREGFSVLGYHYLKKL